MSGLIGIRIAPTEFLRLKTGGLNRRLAISSGLIRINSIRKNKMTIQTDIILIVSDDDGYDAEGQLSPGLSELNSMINDRLCVVDKYASGHPNFRGQVFIATVADLRFTDFFICFKKRAPWSNPNAVQLMLKDGDDRFHSVYSPVARKSFEAELGKVIFNQHRNLLDE